MKLNLRGHDDRYAIEQSLLAFFPEERPVYEGEDGDSHAEVTLHEGNVYATGVTTLTYGGKTARGEARVRTAGVSDAYERERLRQRALKLSFFRAARDVTGVTPSWGALTGIRPAKLVRTMLEDGMTGKSHTDPSATPFALEIMHKLNAACKTWKAQHNIDFSLYGTPLESTTYKFAKCLQKRFGVIEGITDKGYITNSYHVHVTEPIDAFKKLEFEAQFQHLSPGGAISYVEVPDMQNNLDAVLEVMKFIYDHIIYAELNTKSDYCQVCGWDGEIEVVEEDGKLIWKCPQCGNTDQDKMNVARRTCGYIGTQFWNQGRTQEIKDRVLHL